MKYSQHFYQVAPLSLIYSTRRTMQELTEIEFTYKPLREKLDLTQTELNNLKPDLNQKFRDRLDKILLDAGKIIIFAAGGQQFIQGMRKQGMTQDQFIQGIVEVGKDCMSFITDIEKHINR